MVVLTDNENRPFREANGTCQLVFELVQVQGQGKALRSSTSEKESSSGNISYVFMIQSLLHMHIESHPFDTQRKNKTQLHEQ